MLNLTGIELAALVTQWTMPMLRIGGLIMTAPIVGTRVVPGRVRLVLMVAISLALVPVIKPIEGIEVLSVAGFLVAAQQVMIGALLGLILRFVFMVVEFAGQIVAQQMGLGFASLVDPQTGLQVPVVSQFYIVLATLTFFTFDGHLILFSVLAASFQTIPVGLGGITRDGLAIVLGWSSFLFAGALAISLPTVIALLVVNIAFGVMARSAPQLNVFAVGFPVMILFGIFISYLTLDNLSMHLRQHFEMAFGIANQVLISR